MKLRNKMAIATILVLIFSNLHSQDAFFSQLSNTPNLLNPSLLSIQNASLKVDLNYREQGGSASTGPALKTFQVLANYAHRSFKADRMSYGISVLNDRGGVGQLTSNMAHLHFAYLKKLTGKYSKIGEHYIGLGTSLGVGQKTIDSDRFWFGNQFNEESNFVDFSTDPVEDRVLLSSSGRSDIFTDVNAGIVWYANLNDRLSATAGFSIFHLEMANISLFEGIIVRQSRRYSAHLSITQLLGDVLVLTPRVVFTNQGTAYQIVLGSELAVDNRDDREFILKFGGYGRIVSSFNGGRMDAFVLTMNFSYEDFIFGVGYDLILSSLSTQNNSRSAWELRLGYKIGGSKIKGSRRGNTFRF